MITQIPRKPCFLVKPNGEEIKVSVGHERNEKADAEGKESQGGKANSFKVAVI